MKVLWVTNTPCSSVERNGRYVRDGNWMSSLEKAVRGDITLEIAYYTSGQESEDFVYEGVKYYPIAPYLSGSYMMFRLRRLFSSYSGQDSRILDRLEGIILESRPDIIHIHGIERCFGLISEKLGGNGGYVTAGGTRIPVVISIQGLMGETVKRYFRGISYKDVQKYESLRCRLLKQSPLTRYRQMLHQSENEKRILGKARYIIGRTDWDRIMTSYANPEREYFHVGEIMRSPFYTLGGRIPSAGILRLASTVSGGIYKGFEFLLKVAAELTSRHIAFSWMVIGYTSSTEAVSISEKSTGLHSSDLCIRFTGMLDAEGIVRELSQTDIYCQVSHIENSPNSLCEAMLQGLPCIATDVGGTSTIAGNGELAILVPDDDPKTYADVIINLAEDSSRCRELGEAAREAALVRHDPEKIKSQLLHTYSEIISRSI